MTWFWLALATAVATASRESLIKLGMREGAELLVAGTVTLVGAALLVPAVFVAGVPEIRPGFWTALLISGSVNAVASVAIARSVHISDISLVAPLQSLTPIFMLATGLLFLGELPGPRGIAGVLVIVAGSYLLGYQPRAGSWLMPLRALARDRGARLMFGVAVIFSISGAIDKVGVLASSPLFWAAALNATIAFVLLSTALLRGSALPGRWLAILGAGVLMAAGMAAQMAALPLTLAAYVIAVKRLSTLFAVLIGGLLFREPATRTRLVAAAIMVAGLMLIVLE